jgi:hypothetical protein
MYAYAVYIPERPLDFSVGNRDPLDESNLDENKGIGEAVRTVWRLANGSIIRSNGNLAIDWNVDKTLTANVQMNLNNFPLEPNANDDETLRDFNDWDNLLYRYRGLSDFGFGAKEEPHVELTSEEIEVMREEAKTIIEVSSPEPSEQPQDLPTEILYVIGIVMIGIIVLVVYMIMLRKKKK